MPGIRLVFNIILGITDTAAKQIKDMICKYWREKDSTTSLCIGYKYRPKIFQKKLQKAIQIQCDAKLQHSFQRPSVGQDGTGHRVTQRTAVFLIKQTACHGPTFSTVAAEPPLSAQTPFHLPVRACLCLSLSGSVLQTGSLRVSGRRTAGCPRRTTPAGQALPSLPGTHYFQGEWLVTHFGLQPHCWVPRAPRAGLSAFQPGSRAVPLTARGYAHARARVAGWGVGGWTSTGRLTRTTCSGGRAPTARGAISTEERGTSTLRGWRTAAAAPATHPWLPRTRASRHV